MVLTAAFCLAVFTAPALLGQNDPSSNQEGALTAAEARKLKNPVAYSKKSIAQGRTVFVRYCVGCHGMDGKATVDVVADATDLTAPSTWKNGTTEGEIFRSIRDGQGASMPAFKSQIR